MTDRQTEKEGGADVEEVSDGVGGVSQSCVQLDAGSALYSQLVALLKHLLLHRLLAGCRRLQQLSISTTTTTNHQPTVLPLSMYSGSGTQPPPPGTQPTVLPLSMYSGSGTQPPPVMAMRYAA